MSKKKICTQHLYRTGPYDQGTVSTSSQVKVGIRSHVQLKHQSGAMLNCFSIYLFDRKGETVYLPARLTR